MRKLANRLRSDRKLRRYLIFSLTLDGIAYAAVYLLVSHGVMNTWWANTAVSKGMAPAGLILNTLALTGRMRPNRYQMAKWLAYWLPSAIAGMVCLAFVIAQFGLGSVQARLVVGVILFPIDYAAKRFVVFAQQVRLMRLVFKLKFVLVFAGVLLVKRITLAGTNLRLQLVGTA